jgi:hypothetical protein
MADGDRFATAVIRALAHPAVAKELAPEPLGSATECEALITQAASLVNLPDISQGPPLFQRESEKEGGPEAEPGAAPDNSLGEASAASPKAARDWLFVQSRSGTSEREGDRGRSAAGPYAVLSEPPTPRRYAYAAFAVILALFALAWFWPASKPPRPIETSVAEPAPAPSAAPALEKTNSQLEQQENDDRTWPTADEPPGILRGVPEVIDAATIRLEGRVVRLFGAEWAGGAQAEDLAGYLRGREVECEFASAPDLYRCHVGGHDLSRAVLFNGGARATTEISPELRAAGNPAASAAPAPPDTDTSEGQAGRLTAAAKLAVAQPPYPRAVQQTLDQDLKECLAQGGTSLTYKPGVVHKGDLTGDGRDDYMVDFRAGFCTERLHMINRTVGWNLDIFIARPKSSLTRAFSGRVRDYDISAGPGPRTMTFQLHGGQCGLATAEECLRRRKMSARAFAFRGR